MEVRCEILAQHWDRRVSLSSAVSVGRRSLLQTLELGWTDASPTLRQSPQQDKTFMPRIRDYRGAVFIRIYANLLWFVVLACSACCPNENLTDAELRHALVLTFCRLMQFLQRGAFSPCHLPSYYTGGVAVPCRQLR